MRFSLGAVSLQDLACKNMRSSARNCARRCGQSDGVVLARKLQTIGEGAHRRRTEGESEPGMADLDLVVLGGGTGGYVAAIRAAQLGLRVAVVEKDKLGGTCLHRGCIPSKSYLRSAEVFHTFRHAGEYGLTAGEVAVNWTDVYARKEKIVSTLHKGIQGLLKKNKITVFQGAGTLMAPSIFAPSGWLRVEQGGGDMEKLEPEFILVATGSRPRTLGLPVDGRQILTSDEALQIDHLPKSILIIGGGVIGMEWASMYNDFGVEVTVVEALPRILPFEDEEVAAELGKLLKRRGVKILTGAAVETDSVRVADDQVSLRVTVDGQPQELAAEKLLVSVGRAPNSDGIGLENFEKIQVERGVIQVDAFGRTGQPGVYAIGDVVGGALAHVAAHQGIVAVEHMKGLDPHPVDPVWVPRCTYTRPEVASVGLTEAQARERGHQVKVGKFPFRGIGKALVYGEADGFAKLVADERTGELLGAHLIGPHATDLISEAGLAGLLNATAWEMSVFVHPHPTLSEIFGEAALAVEDRQIHG